MRKAVVQIVEDHPAISLAIATALNKQRYSVGSQAETVSAAIENTLRHPVDLVILDLRLPGPSGESLLHHYRKSRPHTPVLVYSATSNLKIAARCIRHGAKGFVRKSSPFNELLDAIDKVYFHQQRHIPAELDHFLASHHGENSGLTCREQDVLLLIARGRTNRETAQDLGISERTVNIHRTNLMSKIGASNISEVTLYAVGAGMLEPDEFLDQQNPSML